MITTNHPDKIGKALARKGRLDLKIYFGYASNDEIKEYFNLFYKFFEIDEKKITNAVDEFIKKIRNYEKGSEITFVQLQQFLVQYLGNIDKMLDNINVFFESENFECYA